MENKLKTKKALYIALSLLVAVVIWVFVDRTGNPDGSARLVTKEFTGLSIVYENEEDLADRGLMLLPDGTDTTVDVTLEGTRWDIACMDKDDLVVKVDLSDVAATGAQRLSIQFLFQNGMASKFSRSVEPSMATVNIAELYKKTVDVRCELVGNVAEGYTAGQLQLSHTSIEIRGQQEDIDPVSYVKATLDLGQDAVATVSQALDYRFYDQNGQVIDNSDGLIHTTVEAITATLPVSVTKELPLRLNFLESPGARSQNVNVELYPATITVSGDAAKLRNVNAITLADFDLLTLENGIATYAYPIVVPEGCQNLSGVTRATLTISWMDMTSAEVTTNLFLCENIPEGKTAEVLTQEMTVQIFGTTADVEAVTGENVTLVADLSDYSAVSGGYTVPATVRIDSGGDVGVSGDYQVQITIRERGPEQEAPEE